MQHLEPVRPVHVRRRGVRGHRPDRGVLVRPDEERRHGHRRQRVAHPGLLCAVPVQRRGQRARLLHPPHVQVAVGQGAEARPQPGRAVGEQPLLGVRLVERQHVLRALALVRVAAQRRAEGGRVRHRHGGQRPHPGGVPAGDLPGDRGAPVVPDDVGRLHAPPRRAARRRRPRARPSGRPRRRPGGRRGSSRAGRGRAPGSRRPAAPARPPATPTSSAGSRAAAARPGRPADRGRRRRGPGRRRGHG